MIIQKSSDSKLREKIATNLEKFARNFQQENNLKEMSLFLPTKYFIKLLNDEKICKLSKTEIMGLMAFTDCYDSKGLNIDHLLFTNYVTNAIVMINNKKIFNGTPLEDLGSVRTLNSNVRTHIKYFFILS